MFCRFCGKISPRGGRCPYCGYDFTYEDSRSVAPDLGGYGGEKDYSPQIIKKKNRFAFAALIVTACCYLIVAGLGGEIAYVVNNAMGFGEEDSETIKTLIICGLCLIALVYLLCFSGTFLALYGIYKSEDFNRGKAVSVTSLALLSPILTDCVIFLIFISLRGAWLRDMFDLLTRIFNM